MARWDWTTALCALIALGNTGSTFAADAAPKSAPAVTAPDKKASGSAATTGNAASSGTKTGSPAASEKQSTGAPAKAASAPVMSPELTVLVNRVQSAYARLETLQADFSQTSKLTSMSKSRTDTGTVAFKRGGKMRWDFLTPEPRQFVSDGKTLWIYAPKDKQVIESALQTGASETALNFMAGLGDLHKEFNPALANEKEYQRPSMSALHLAPKASIGTVKRLTLVVADGDGVVREAYVDDAMGTTTHIVFSQLKINPPIADAAFNFKIPAGVEVVRPQGF